MGQNHPMKLICVNLCVSVVSKKKNFNHRWTQIDTDIKGKSYQVINIICVNLCSSVVSKRNFNHRWTQMNTDI